MNLSLAAIMPLSHEATLLFLSQLTLLLLTARLLGEWMRRMEQPAVIGELLAGLLLGPSVFGQLAPDWYVAVFPPDQLLSDLLSAFSLLGVLMLLIVTGFEIDLHLIRQRLRTAAGVSVGGLVVPFGFGLAMGFSLPDVYLARADQRLVFALFMAVNMSISAIPVIAKILIDLKVLRRDMGQITMAAAMLDDAVGWVLLSVAAALATSGHVTWQHVAYSVVASVSVMAVGLWLGRPWVNRSLRWLDESCPGEAPQLTGILFLGLAMSIMTHGLGLESMLGAFLAGILVGQSPRLRNGVAHTLELFTASFFAPIFFACAGLKVNLTTLFTPSQMALTLAVLLVATLGKYVGCYLGGWWGGLKHWERVALGSGMNPRGAMGVIVARVGLSLGILTTDTYSVMISMAILTSLAAPPLLRWSLARVEIGEEEAQRLANEDRKAESFLTSLHKVLMPSRGGTNVQWAAFLLGHLSHHHPVGVTALFALPSPGEQPPPEAVAALKTQLQQSHGSAPRVKKVNGVSVADAILNEATKGGYDLLVMGATGQGAEGIFNQLIDTVLSHTPCATMVVRAHPTFDEEGGSIAVRRILLPAVGTQYSRRAAEVVAVICRSLGARLTVVHVTPLLDPSTLGPRSHELSLAFGKHVVDDHADVARGLGAAVDTQVLSEDPPEKAILEFATTHGYDLIFMGLNSRPLGGQAFIGHRAERIMRGAPCAVAVLSSG